MGRKGSLNTFITCFAKKVAATYNSNYADEEDYIQVGHLKLAEIKNSKFKKHNFTSYAITAIARAIRFAAIDTMCGVSASHRTKERVHKIGLMLSHGMTEQEICLKIGITQEVLNELRTLIKTESFDTLFDKPAQYYEQSSVINDILLSDDLDDEDKIFIQTKLSGDEDVGGLSKRQQWLKIQKIKSQLVRSNYEI